MVEVDNRITSAQGIIDKAKELGSSQGPFRVAVAAAEDADVLTACAAASLLGVAQFTLYGAETKLKEMTEGLDTGSFPFRFVDCDSASKSTHLAAKAADAGEAEVIMKGFLPTSALLKTILSKDFALRKKDTISHVAVLDIPGYHKLLGITDGGMVVKPTLEQKIDLIDNAVLLFNALGFDRPKVAVSSPVDYLNPRIPATTEAAQLTALCEKGEITGCDVFGPITFDAATSRRVAERRSVDHPVAGDADIFLVDTIEECNVVSKVMILFSPAAFAGVIVGAGVPVSLVSRTDTASNKLTSISIACLLAHFLKSHTE